MNRGISGSKAHFLNRYIRQPPYIIREHLYCRFALAQALNQSSHLTLLKLCKSSRKSVSLSAFYKWGNNCTKIFSNLSKVSQVVSDRGELNPSLSDSKAFSLYPLERCLRASSDFVGPEVYILWSRKLLSFVCKIIHGKLGTESHKGTWRLFLVILPLSHRCCTWFTFMICTITNFYVHQNLLWCGFQIQEGK